MKTPIPFGRMYPSIIRPSDEPRARGGDVIQFAQGEEGGAHEADDEQAVALRRLIHEPILIQCFNGSPK